MFIQGKPKVVILDDYFPCFKSGNFCFCYSGQNEIWVQVLEKAWAKLNSSYAMTIAGLPSEAFSALDESPTIVYTHKKYEKNLDELWNILQQCDKENYVMCTSCGGGAEGKLEEVGLVNGHAYSLIAAKSSSKDPSVRLIQLRNPWGNYEWKGKYCDGDKKSWTKDLIKEFGMINNEKDGLFWMHMDDFVQYFGYTFINKFNESYVYCNKKFMQDPADSFVSGKVTVTKDNTHVYFGLHQKQIRFYNKVPKYVPNQARIILAKYDELKREYTFIDCDASNNDKLWIEAKLSKGVYHLFAKSYWPYKNAKCSLVMSTYSNQKLDIEALDASSISVSPISDILHSFAVTKGELLDLKSAKLYHSLNDNNSGFYLVSIDNPSSKAVEVGFTVKTEGPLLSIESPGVTYTKKAGGLINVSIKANASSYGTAIFELLAEPWDSAITNIDNISCKASQAHSEGKTLLDKAIAKLSDSSTEFNPINNDCKYFEMEVDDGIAVVFANSSSTNSYQFTVKFDLDGLSVDKSTPQEFILSSKKPALVHLIYNPDATECNYSITLNFKKK